MNEERRQIVNQVAEGTLSPEEAAARLEELDRAAAPTSAVATVSQAEGGTVSAVSVSVSLGSVTVLGDTSVREVVAEGTHSARNEGGRLVIEGDTLNNNGFTFGGSRGWFGGGNPWKSPLVIRMNPALPLEVVVQGGRASVNGVTAPIKASVQAGAMDIRGFEAPLDLSTEAGAIRAAGRLSAGDSKIRCGAGSVRLELLSGTSLKVTAHSEIGHVRLDGGGWRTEPRTGAPGEVAVLGAGAGTLDVDVTIGAVRLVSP